MAALAAVCEAIDQKPELQLHSLDTGPLERLLASLQLNQVLQKPHPEEQSRCAHPSGQHVHKRRLCCSCWKVRPVSVTEVTARHVGQGFGSLETRPRQDAGVRTVPVLGAREQPCVRFSVAPGEGVRCPPL